MTADKRSVATDALEVLGTIITDKKVGRDAVHLACLPVIVADQWLVPGSHVGLTPNGTASAVVGSKRVGIIDPFLDSPVKQGQEVLLLIYPRTIESLRHVWSHPDIPDEPDTNAVSGGGSHPRTPTRALLVEALDAVGRSLEFPVTGEVLLEAMDGGGYINTGASDLHGAVTIPYTLWDMFRDVHGRRAVNDPTGPGDGVYFTCAC